MNCALLDNAAQLVSHDGWDGEKDKRSGASSQLVVDWLVTRGWRLPGGCFAQLSRAKGFAKGQANDCVGAIISGGL